MGRSLKATASLLDKLLGSALILLIVTMVLAVSWQVVSRYLLASPSSWTEELARFALIWIGMLGAAYAFRMGSHMNLDVLPKRLGNDGARRLRAITLGLCALFALLVLVIGGGSLMSLTLELRQTSPALGLPMALVYSVIPVAGLLILMYAVAGLADVRREADR